MATRVASGFVPKFQETCSTAIEAGFQPAECLNAITISWMMPRPTGN
jgi:hypothetical protein